MSASIDDRSQRTKPAGDKIPTICPFCGRRYQVDAAFVGKRIHCKNCPNSFPIQPSAPAARSGSMTVSTEKPTFPTKPLIAVGSVALVGICTLVVFLHVQAADRERVVVRNTLIRLVDQKIAEASSAAESFEFNTGNRALSAADAAVREASVDIATSDSLNGRIAMAHQRLRSDGDAHAAKVRQGWQVFEGRFISAIETKRILSERQEQARRRQEADRREAEAKRAAAAYAAARETRQKEQARIETDLWKRASDTSGKTSLEDLGILTTAYMEHFPNGTHARAAKNLRAQTVERLWMNRVLDVVDHWIELYKEIRDNQEFIDRAVGNRDAWMHVNQLERLAQLNVKYHQKLVEVSEVLDSIGAGGFQVAGMPTEDPGAITAFCRRNRDPMRYQRWHDAWIKDARAKAKQVSLRVVSKSAPVSPDEITRWSEAEQAWASVPFLEGTTAMARFVLTNPKGSHVQEARERIAAGIAMDWSAQVFLNLRTVKGNRRIADECQRLATDDASQRQALLEQSRQLLDEARDLIEVLQAMGFAGDVNMKLPHEKSNLTEIALFFRAFRLPGKYAEWEERRLAEVFADATK